MNLLFLFQWIKYQYYNDKEKGVVPKVLQYDRTLGEIPKTLKRWVDNLNVISLLLFQHCFCKGLVQIFKGTQLNGVI